MASLLTAMDGTVTVCHSKSVGLEEIVKRGDIVVVAIGRANLVR